MRIDFRGGGWVLALTGVLIVAVLAWRVAAILPTLGQRAVGDRRSVESYGFDLSNCLVPRDGIVSTGMARDELHALVDPPAMTAEQLDAVRLGRASFLVPGDRVIGVEIDGAARAYPLRILIWHEIVNDALAGVPIAVTYHAPSGAAAAFDRRSARGESAAEGDAPDFGVSGLVFNSNLLMYDRGADTVRESLWCQLQARAVAGPAAGRRLTLVPAALLTWSQWRALHPDTSVLAPDAARMKLYKRDAYATYFASQRLMFPAAPLPDAAASSGVAGTARALKTECVGVRTADRWHVFAVSELARQAGPAGTRVVRLGADEVRWVCAADPPAAWVRSEPGSAAPETAYGFWFAWYALHEELRGPQ